MDRFLSEIGPASLALAAVILGVAGLLGYREWLDRRTRPAEASSEDHEHLGRRDRRRSLGLTILCILALGVVVGSRIPIRAGRDPNPLFLFVWLGVFALILTLLTLALVDWFDLRRYARRKRSAMGREHLTLLQADLQHRIDRADRGGGPDTARGS